MLSRRGDCRERKCPGKSSGTFRHESSQKIKKFPARETENKEENADNPMSQRLLKRQEFKIDWCKIVCKGQP